MARFNFMISRNICVFVDILLILGTSASKCENLPFGKLWIKTLGRGGGDWVQRWSSGNNLVHFFEILFNFTNSIVFSRAGVERPPCLLMRG